MYFEINVLSHIAKGGLRNSYIFFPNHFSTSKAIMPLKCKGLLEVEKNEKTLLCRKDNKSTVSGEKFANDVAFTTLKLLGGNSNLEWPQFISLRHPERLNYNGNHRFRITCWPKRTKYVPCCIYLPKLACRLYPVGRGDLAGVYVSVYLYVLIPTSI